LRWYPSANGNVTIGMNIPAASSNQPKLIATHNSNTP
jgi:hypothetical protein